MKRITAVLLAIFFIIPALVYSGTGTESMQFLKINPDARGASLNDGYVAATDSVNSIFYNPAGLTSMKYMTASLMHMMYVAETSYEYAAFGLPVSDNIKAALYVVYLNYGSMLMTTENLLGTYTGTAGEFTPYNLAVAGGVGVNVTKEISVGGNLKYAMEDIAGDLTGGIMGDAGVKIDFYDFCFGAAVYNIGRSIGEGRAPMMGRAGLSTRFSIAYPQDLLLVGGANYVLASAKLAGSLGAEYIYNGSVFVRASYELGKDVNAVNAGVGIKSGFSGINYGVDYNIAFMGNLGTTHRISLTVAFAEDEAQEKEKKAGGKKGGIRTFKIK